MLAFMEPPAQQPAALGAVRDDEEKPISVLSEGVGCPKCRSPRLALV
jgi:hypothetical protein